MQTVIETSEYLARAKDVGLDDAERAQVVDFLAAHPLAGDEIPGTGGARKVRFAGRGKGKSGGYRVVTYFGGADIPLFLLTVYAKGEKANLSQAERNALKRLLSSLAKTYRSGVANNVKSRPKHP
ncbi:MAG: addiction module toxin RelE [Proteobacteria bacterium]|nr:MAG: addiction module toxin RelE [Pseudomonadota bacterium]